MWNVEIHLHPLVVEEDGIFPAISSYLTDGNQVFQQSGDYTVLIDNLQDKPSLEEAIRDYVPKTIEIWRNGSGKEDMQKPSPTPLS